MVGSEHALEVRDGLLIDRQRVGQPAGRVVGAGQVGPGGEGVPVIRALDPLPVGDQALESRPDAAFASHWLRAFGDETWDWTPTDCSFPELLHANTVNGAALLRREVFDSVGGFDESMVDGCEDWEFWIRVVQAGYQGVIIPEFLFRYRRRADSMSRAMHAVPGMPALYRQLVDRHPDVFARHLVALLERRDSEIASLSRPAVLYANASCPAATTVSG